ncbi:MAG: hypothetical protein R3250_12095, partial [Melioribacteraceae bacterium]|nr:hypothetical protein [Melioribacteraceae bacterium]
MEDPIIAPEFPKEYHPDNTRIQCNDEQAYGLLKEAYQQNDTVFEFLEKFAKNFGNEWIVQVNGVLKANSTDFDKMYYDMETETFFVPRTDHYNLNNLNLTDRELFGSKIQDIVNPFTN